MEATAIVPVWSLTRLLVEARMIHFLVVILCFYRSHPRCPCIGLDGDRSGCHINRSSQVPGVITGGGEDCPLLSGDCSFLSLPPQSLFRQTW